MIQGELGGILEELGRELGIQNLGPDDNETCLLRLKNGIKIQIEILKGGNYLLIASDLGEIPPGRYRIDLFEAALTHNVSDEAGIGTLGFSKRSNHMLLFEKLSMKGLTGLKVADTIEPLSERAKLWISAIQKGEIPRLEEASTNTGHGIFGLKP